MILANISLVFFRSHRKNSFTFSPQITLVIGANGIGKTNLLEAIYLLATGKSFRADAEEEMIVYGEEIARVRAKIQNVAGSRQQVVGEVKDSQNVHARNFRETQLEIVLTRGEVQGERTPRKKFLVEGVGKRMVDFVGNLRAVLFWPQDIEIVTGSPSKRRNYLDLVLAQVDRDYRRSLTTYEHGLRQRNRLLKLVREGKARRDQLVYWDELLVTNGSYLTKKRQELVDFINSEKRGLDDQVMEVYYDKSVISPERLAIYKAEEVAAATTLVGPHRDDFVIQVKSEKLKVKSQVKSEKLRNLHSFGSRGEQRLAVLWLKLAEVDYIQKVTGERPILLLDDIFSELDHEHRALVMDIIPKQQTIITTTDIHLVDVDKSNMEIVQLEDKKTKNK